MSPPQPQHTEISPAILYWGTPVVLITTENPDGTTNIGPMSSAWWIGRSCMLGLSAFSQTTANLRRTGECVLNLASEDMTANVNAIAKTTGSDPVPEGKLRKGYTTLKDKFGAAGLTTKPSQIVKVPGIQECPVVLEAKFVAIHELFGGTPAKGACLAIEVEVVRVSVYEELRLAGHANRIDADAWKPMIMMFCDFYGLRHGTKLDHSRLAEIDEELYRMPKRVSSSENDEEQKGKKKESLQKPPVEVLTNGVEKEH